MDKHRQLQPDELSPGLDGPDYVALVIEWEDLVDPFDETAVSGMQTARRPAMRIPENDPNWNSVDEASMESFPASDPPAWGSSHAVANAGVPEDISEEVTSPFKPESELSGVKRIVLGLAALAALFSMIEGMRRIRHRA